MLALALGLACLAVNVHWARGQEQKAVPQQTEPARDTSENRVLVWHEPAQDQAQDKQRAELEALRHRVRELEAQLKDRGLLDLEASDKAQAQIVEKGARRLTDQKFQAEIQLQNLTLMLADSQHRLAGLQNLYTDDYPDVKAQKVRIAGLEDSMVVLERQLAQDNTSQAQVNKRLTELQSQIRAMQEKHRELELLNEEMATKRLAELQRQLIVSKQALTNWTVKSIDIVGLSGEPRDALLANLPVKLGSKLAEGSVDAIAAALKKFDAHLTFTVPLSGSGEAVIHIARPKN